MVFCPKCGEKQDNNEAKFCQKWGSGVGFGIFGNLFIVL